MIRSISQLKAWFRKGSYPTENQFADLIDSFRHKEEKLNISDVDQLSTQLNNRPSRSEYTIMSNSVANLTNEVVETRHVVNNFKQNFSELSEGHYKGVRQVDKLVLDENAAVAVEMGSTELGGVVEYYASGGFVLRASDGKRYTDWSTRWWFYTPEGKIRTDVLLMVGTELWHWSGSRMEPVVAELTDGQIEAAIDALEVNGAAMGAELMAGASHQADVIHNVRTEQQMNY